MGPRVRGDDMLTVIASQRVDATRRLMTGSAKQSAVRATVIMDCFVASAFAR
jgi:hypothetical protein